MRPVNFKYFKKYFSENENWGNLKKVRWDHIKVLYDIRESMSVQYNWPMIIHCCYAESGHAENSYHYQGLATDFHFKTNVSLKNQYKVLRGFLKQLNLWNYVGIGVYDDWNNPGFHIDSRGEPVRWLRSAGKYFYGDEILNRYFGE